MSGLCARTRVDIVQANLDPIPVRSGNTKSLLMLYDVMRIDKAYVSRVEHGLRMRARTWLRYRLARRADHVLTISEFSKQRVADTLDLPPERITVTPLAASRVFGPGEPHPERLNAVGLEAPFLLFVGDFGRQKNEAGLIEAFLALAEASRISPDVLLALIGDPARMTERAREAIRGSVHGQRVKILGHVDEEMLVSLYRAALALVLPSFVEGFGLPAIEAMACGCPVIVSDAASLPEVVGEAAIVAKAGSAGALADAMHRVCNSPEERGKLAQAGLTRAASFSYEKTARRTLELWRSLADRGVDS